MKVEDARLLRQLAPRRHSSRGAVTRQVVPWADHLKAWLVMSPLLVAAGQRGRRAVLDGWKAVAVATMLGKAIEAGVQRRRPGRSALRGRLTAGAKPSSSSFPSTHTATAVAFAGAACSALPPATWVLGPLAGFVAWSRPAGGRHYPSDVVGGVLTGAAAAGIVRRWGRPLERRPLAHVRQPSPTRTRSVGTAERGRR
jgi:membrane-associated phospholipid phosphatase